MKYAEITIKTNREYSDILMLDLMDIGAEGVNVIDDQETVDFLSSQTDWDYVAEDLLKVKDNAVYLKTCFDLASKQKVAAYLQQKLEEYAATNAQVKQFEITIREVDDTQWKDVWKQFYEPIVIGSYVVVPKWIEYFAKPNENILRIDPGAAFGTGQHETTGMCLQLMDALNMSEKKVLDLGCGSGILGIGAHKKQARAVAFVDVQQDAIINSQENCALNEISGNVRFLQGDISVVQNEQFDITIANLTATILMTIISQVTDSVASGGIIILSGIIADKVQEVKNAFTQSGELRLVNQLQKGEWWALQLQKM